VEREPTTTITTLTETDSRSADIGSDPSVRPLPTVRPATHTVSDIPMQIVTDDHVINRAVQRWREPKYLTNSTFAARARSFFNWPQYPQKPSPDALSKAGFFYTGKCNFFYFTLRPIHIFSFRSVIIFLHLSTGIGDKTICFHCGGSLVDWGCDDHPFSEHAASFPYCVYVNNIRGPDFVGDCLRMRSLRERHMEYQYPCTGQCCTTTPQIDMGDHLPI
jgi:hypothetical protein